MIVFLLSQIPRVRFDRLVRVVFICFYPSDHCYAFLASSNLNTDESRSLPIRGSGGGAYWRGFCADDAAYYDYAGRCADVGANGGQGAGVFVDRGGLRSD